MIRFNTSRVVFVGFCVLLSQGIIFSSNPSLDSKKDFIEQCQAQGRQVFDQMQHVGSWMSNSATSSVQSVEQLWVQRNQVFHTFNDKVSVSSEKIEEVKEVGGWIKNTAIGSAVSIGQIGDSAINCAESVIQELKDPEHCWLPAGVIGSYVYHLKLRRGKRNVAASATPQGNASSVKVDTVSSVKTPRISRFVRSVGCRIKWFVIPAITWSYYVNYKEKLQQQVALPVESKNSSTVQKSKVISNNHAIGSINSASQLSVKLSDAYTEGQKLASSVIESQSANNSQLAANLPQCLQSMNVSLDAKNTSKQ